MKDTTAYDLFYHLEDIRNLFKNPREDRYYKQYKIVATIPIWTGECASKLTYYKRYLIDS